MLVKRSSSRTRTRWIGCLIRSLCACRSVWWQQRSRRSSRTHDPAYGTPLILLVMGMLDVFVTIIVSARNEQDNFQDMLFETGYRNNEKSNVSEIAMSYTG